MSGVNNNYYEFEHSNILARAPPKGHRLNDSVGGRESIYRS